MDIKIKKSNKPRRKEEWEVFVELIDDLLEDSEAQFAEDTLSGIKATVQRMKRVSDNQKRAVSNIEAAVQRAHDRQDRGQYYRGFDY